MSAPTENVPIPLITDVRNSPTGNRIASSRRTMVCRSFIAGQYLGCGLGAKMQGGKKTLFQVWNQKSRKRLEIDERMHGNKKTNENPHEKIDSDARARRNGGTADRRN